MTMTRTDIEQLIDIVQEVSDGLSERLLKPDCPPEVEDLCLFRIGRLDTLKLRLLGELVDQREIEREREDEKGRV